MTAAHSTDALDAIFQRNQGQKTALENLAPRAGWTDKHGKRWSMASYASTQALIEHVWNRQGLPFLKDTLTAVAECRLQSRPSTMAGRMAYQADLVALWTAMALGGRGHFRMDTPIVQSLQKAMQDPEMGPGRAGWGTPGDGWLAQALDFLLEARLTASTRTPSDAFLSSPMALSTRLFVASENALSPCFFEPQDGFVQGSDLLGFSFDLRGATRAAVGTFPPDIEQGFGLLVINTMAAHFRAYQEFSSFIPGRQYASFWRNVGAERTTQARSMLFDQASKTFSQAGVNEEPVELSRSAEQLALMAVSTIPHTRQDLGAKETYVTQALIRGHAKTSPETMKLIEDAGLDLLIARDRSQNLNQALPAPTFHGRLRAGPRF